MASQLTYQEYNKKSLAVFGDRAKYGKSINSIGGRWNSKLKGDKEGWLVPREKEADLKRLIESVNILVAEPAKNSRTDELAELQQKVKSRKNQKRFHRAISNTDSSTESSDSESPRKSREVKERSHGNASHISVREILPAKTLTREIPVGAEPHESVLEKPTRVSRETHTRDSREAHTRDEVKSKILADKKAEEKRKFEAEKEQFESRKNTHREREKHKPMRKRSDISSDSDESDDSPVKYYKKFAKNPDRSKIRQKYEASSSEDVSDTQSDSSESDSDGYPEPVSPKKHKRDKERDQLYRKIEELTKKLYKRK